MRARDLGEYLLQRDCYVPRWKVTSDLVQIRDVADVITNAVLIHIFVVKLLASYALSEVNGLKNRNAVLASAAKIIDFPAFWVVVELLENSAHIQRMYVVPDLFAFVTIYTIVTSFSGALDEIG